MQRAFNRAEKTLRREFRDELRDIAEPVAADAERLAVAGIPRIGLRWSRMRIGVTIGYGVYVAPKQRGVKTRGFDPRRRPNLARLLSERALEPALDMNRPAIEERVEHFLAVMADDWGRGG